MTFPAGPIDGQTYTNALSTVYKYDSTRTTWLIKTQNGLTGIQGPTGLQGTGFTGLQGTTGLKASTGSYNFSISSPIGSVPTGIMGQAVLDSNTAFNTWTVLVDSSSTVTLDVLKSTYANYPSTTSMCGSTGIFISASVKNTGTTGYWTAGITGASGDILVAKLLSTDNTASKVILNLGYTLF